MDDNFIIGGCIIGSPLMTYGRSKNFSWGATALNPDISDLFVEKVKDDKYFYDNEWH